VFSSRRHRLRQAPQILEAVNPGPVTISPVWLNRVTADDFESNEVKAIVGVTDPTWAGQDISEHAWLAAAGRARTGATQKLEIEIRLRSVVPLNRQLAANLLNVCRLQAHWDFNLITMSLLRAIPEPWRDGLCPVRRITGRRSSLHHSFVRLRPPKIAVPTRTSVAPSSTAIRKSWVMPIES
jgi:hypothetical protein